MSFATHHLFFSSIIMPFKLRCYSEVKHPEFDKKKNKLNSLNQGTVSL